jgi:hypothetical protein
VASTNRDDGEREQRRRTIMADRPIQIDVQKYLSGVDYPATKADLVGVAQGQGAPTEVVDALEALPDRQFESPVQVSEGISGS